MWSYNQTDYLAHHGILGMKWGVRRYQNKDGSLTEAGKMRYIDTDTNVTKNVKKDYNDLSDEDFRRKYSTTKKTYAKRVEKYGDPYANSPIVKRSMHSSEKQLNKIGKSNDKKISALNKDINSFKGYENGVFTKNGKMILSSDDVYQSVSALKTQRDKYSKQVTDMVATLSKDYVVSYDIMTGEYKLKLKT